MLRHDIIHLLHQIQTLKCDMSAALLKVADGEHIVFKDLPSVIRSAPDTIILPCQDKA